MSFGKFKDDKTTGSIAPAGNSRASVTGAGSDALLGIGSKISGKISFEGAAEISGEVEGEVHAKGRLTVGETARVKARIEGVEIIVKGLVEGDIIASKRLALVKPARVSGNISSASISIEEGVLFEGSCQMIQAVNTTQRTVSGVAKKEDTPGTTGSES